MIEDLALKLAPHLFWGGLLVFIILRFPRLFEHFVAKINRLSLSADGVEIERSVEAAARAISTKEGIVSLDRKRIRSQLARVPAGARVLWVDDHHEGNESEVEALEAAGLVVIKAASNSEAAVQFQGTEFNLILSDISREREGESGLELPLTISRNRNRVPPLIYYVRDSKNDRTPDGYPVVTRPSELFDVISITLLLGGSLQR